MTKFKLSYGRTIKTHNKKDCKGDICPVHKPTDHHMRDFSMIWRSDRAIFERICPHGVGHPDPDDAARWPLFYSEEDVWANGVHGCDGCCLVPEGDNE